MKAIVTTTINPITKALEKFLAMKEWRIFVVGDLKTPHKEYDNIPGVTYLHPDFQAARWPKLSEMIGFNCIQRRNFGFLYAYECGAEVVASVDDDNIPYDDWDSNLLVNQTVEVDYYKAKNGVFDPLSVTNHKDLWHRGYPWELVKTKNDVSYLGKTIVTVDVQAGLWNGDPDIDAVERIIFSPTVKFDKHIEPYYSDQLTVFNSQNTFISRKVLPNYMMIPFVGRMDDIWGAYILQKLMDIQVVFTKATVYQERNVQSLYKNMRDEMIGYENNLEITTGERCFGSAAVARSAIDKLPTKSKEALEEYRSLFA